MIHKRGAFLTLGMTFLSIIILALGSVILKNAEDSENRIYELGSMNNLLHLERSLQRAYRSMYFGTFNFSIIHDQTQQRFTMHIPSSNSTHFDEKFRFFFYSFNVSEEFIRTIHPNYNFTASIVLSEGYYGGSMLNATGIITPELNISYVYAHMKTPASLHQLTVPPFSNSLIVYTRSLQSDPVDTYLIQLYGPFDGNVSWGTYTPGTVNITVEYHGPNATTVDSKMSSFTSAPIGRAAQNITINVTGPTPWPIVSVSTAVSGPFTGWGQILIAPYKYNFTAVVTSIYATPLVRNVTFYSYDKFNLSSKDLRIGKATNYRLL